MELLLEKVYLTVDEVQHDLEEKEHDQDKIKFLESVLIDRKFLIKQLMRMFTEKISYQEIFEQFPVLKQLDDRQQNAIAGTLINQWAYDEIIEYCNYTLDFLYKKIKIQPVEPQIFPIKSKISHAKQMVLVERLGILDILDKKGLNKIQKAKVISFLINKDEQNTREYLTYRGSEPKNPKKKQYFYNTPENIDFIDTLFRETNLF